MMRVYTQRCDGGKEDENGIIVTNAPAYSTESVAQHTIALMLELCNHVGAHQESVQEGEWVRSKDFCYWKYPIIELAGKTMGIVGYGSIGRRSAGLAGAFDMNVLVASGHLPLGDMQGEFPGTAVRVVELEELLGNSDFVSLHCPLTEKNRHMINKHSLAKMKKNAYLINTSRGPLICEEDLREAVLNGMIAGAAVDVAEEEPMRANSPLLGADNILVTPHIAWASKEIGGRKMNISLLEPIGVPEEMIESLAEGLKKEGHVFTYYDTKTTDVEELKRRSAGQEIVMIANNPYPDEVVRSCDSLKAIAVAFTGIDHVGLAACGEKGIDVLNCAGYSNQSVAELAVGMAIAVMRKMLEGDFAVRNEKTSVGLVGTEICGKTVGIVGCGQIGFKTAKLFKAFGAEVLAYSRHEKDEWKEAGIRFADMDTLLKESDIVSLHLPLNETTRGFFGSEMIGKMKKDAILINCARGPIVDNAALAEALNGDRIAGAAIDVFDMEPPIPSDYPLCNAKNTLLTPHVAFATKEAMVRRAKIEFDNVYAYLQGKPENLCKF